VVSGFDSDVNYAKVAKASSYLRTPDCLFVSTNTDSGLPCGGDCILPGITACALSNKLLCKQCALSMGRPKFRPPTTRTFSNRSF